MAYTDSAIGYATATLVDPAPPGPYTFDVVTSPAPPSARLSFAPTDIPDGTHTISVTKSFDDVTLPVRGATSHYAVGGAVITDSEFPVGVTVSYMAEAFDDSGASLGTIGPVTAQVDSDPSMVWFSDPSNPNLVLQVEAPGDFAEELTEVREVQTYQIGNRIVALLGALGKLENIPLRVRTTSVEDGELLRTILRQTSVLIRTAPPVDLPRLLYVVVPQVKKKRTGSVNDIQYGGGWANWEMTGQEVTPTTLDILVPLVTWQSVIDALEGATWTEAKALYPTDSWFDVIKDPPGV